MTSNLEEILIEWLKGKDFTINPQSDGFVIHTPVDREPEIHKTEIAGIMSLGTIEHISIDWKTKTLWIEVKR